MLIGQNKSVFAERAAHPRQAVTAAVERERPRDHADGAMPVRQKLARGEISAACVVHRRPRHIFKIAVEENVRDIKQRAQTGALPWRKRLGTRRQNEAVHAASRKQPDIAQIVFKALFAVAEDDVIPPFGKRHLHTAHRLRKKGVCDIGHNDAHNICPAGDKRPGKGIGAVVQLARRFAHPFPCGNGNRGVLAVEHQRYGSLRNTRALCDLPYGHPCAFFAHISTPFSAAYACVCARRGIAHCAPRCVTVRADAVLAKRIARATSAPSESRVTNAPT